jgi:hypothetical protein
MNRLDDHDWMGGGVGDDDSAASSGDGDNGSDDEDTDDDADEEGNDVIAVVTDDEYEDSCWNEELVSDAEDCPHGPNCRHVWCEAWEEEVEAGLSFLERQQIDNLWEKRLALMWDSNLQDRKERRRLDGRWTEEQRLNFIWLRRKRRIEFYARAEVTIVREHGGAWAEDLLPQFLTAFNPRELEVLIAARHKYMNEELYEMVKVIL